MNDNLIIERIPGKLFLSGEYAVLYGAPAIICSVNRYAKVTLNKTNTGYSVFSSPQLGISNFLFNIQSGKFVPEVNTQPESMHFVVAAIEMFYQYFKKSLNGDLTFALDIDTSDFYYTKDVKFGFGSSAAVTVGIIKVLHRLNFDTNISPELLFQLAQTAHHIAQGSKGSGGDIASASYGGTIIYRNSGKAGGVSVRKIELPDGLNIITIWTGKAASTSGYLKAIEDFRKSDPQQFNSIITEMTKTAEECADLLDCSDITTFLGKIPEYYEHLENLGNLAEIDIISDEHKEINEIVRKSGGVYKPSGAGGGDIGVAFFGPKFDFKKLTHGLNEKKYNIINLRLGGKN